MNEKRSLIGRSPDGSQGIRSTALKSISSRRTEYCSGAQGNAVVDIYRSEDDEDRGGLVFEVFMEDADCSFIPLAEEAENGIRLHIAGDSESKAFVNALRKALNDIWPYGS